MDQLKVIIITWIISLLTTTSDKLKTYLPPTTPTPTQTISAQPSDIFNLTRVVDGDTIIVNQNGYEFTVRVIGINTAELKDGRALIRCFANKAKIELQNILSTNQIVLTKDLLAGDKDKYGRLLRYIYVNNQDVGGLLVERGFANVYTNEPVTKLNDYLKLETQAREKGLGLWSSVCN